MILKLTPGPLKGTITPPPSKSQAHRLLIAAYLAGGENRVANLAQSEDIRATGACMEALRDADSGLVRLDCGESGSTLRFLIPVALALRGGGVFTGRGRLMERPQEPYFEIFREKGISFTQKGNGLTVSGRLTPGVYHLPGNVSSQFITGLLYALPLLSGPSEIRLSTVLESAGYVDMTLDALARFGVRAEDTGAGSFFVPGGQHYVARDCVVEPDWSQAGFWYAARGIGNPVEITGMDLSSHQGDRVLEEWAGLLSGPGEVVLDLSGSPDLAPPIAAWAALRQGETTRLVNAGRLRIKESDRLATIASELSGLGVQIEEGADFLTIHGVGALRGGTVFSHNDHRIAMMAAIAATRADGPVVLHDAEAVRKSYPDFWEHYAALGGVWEVPA